MKSSSTFVLIFIGFLVAYAFGAPAATEGVTDDVTTAAVTQAGDAPTTQSDNSPTDASGTTDGSATQASSGTNVPQTTVPPTTAASCPPKDILLIKDGETPAFSVDVLPGLDCNYYARSTSFSKSIVIDVPATTTGAGSTLQIFDDSGNKIYDSSNIPSAPVKSNSSQIKISVTTAAASTHVTVDLSLEPDQCQTPDPCAPNGTCQVIQGQETCTCASCYIGARCETELNPCATYDLVCKVSGQSCQVSPTGCTAQCFTPSTTESP